MGGPARFRRTRIMKVVFLFATLVWVVTGVAADVKYRGFSITESVRSQKPFERAAIAQKQPALFAHLKQIFGDGAGAYAGSLTR